MFLFPDMPPPEYDLSHDTIRRALSFMKDEDINRFFTEYFGAIRVNLMELIRYNNAPYEAEPERETLYFDGQELRSTYRTGETSRSKKGGISVTTFNLDTNQALAFSTVSKKNQEGAAFARSVCSISIDGKIVMADALNTSKQTMGFIVSRGAYYLLPVKENLGN